MVLELLKPLVLAVSAFGKLYSRLFGQRIVARSREREQVFAAEIRSSPSFLFEENHGRLIPNIDVHYPQPFDFVSATVALDDLIFCFFEGTQNTGHGLPRASRHVTSAISK